MQISCFRGQLAERNVNVDDIAIFQRPLVGDTLYKSEVGRRERLLSRLT